MLLSAVLDLQTTIRNAWASVAARAAMALPAPALFQSRSRTGGPDDDEDDELRWLMPILAGVIGVAVLFG